jgi:hypothetical protein
MLKPARWDKLAVVLIRLAGGGVGLGLCLFVLNDWLYTFRNELHCWLLYKLFGIGDVLMSGPDIEWDSPLFWYPNAIATAAMFIIGYRQGCRDSRLVWSMLWCLCCTMGMAMILLAWYGIALHQLMPYDVLVGNIWSVYLLAYGAGWALAFRRPAMSARASGEQRQVLHG